MLALTLSMIAHGKVSQGKAKTVAYTSIKRGHSPPQPIYIAEGTLIASAHWQALQEASLPP